MSMREREREKRKRWRRRDKDKECIIGKHQRNAKSRYEMVAQNTSSTGGCKKSTVVIDNKWQLYSIVCSKSPINV